MGLQHLPWTEGLMYDECYGRIFSEGISERLLNFIQKKCKYGSDNEAHSDIAIANHISEPQLRRENTCKSAKCNKEKVCS